MVCERPPVVESNRYNKTQAAKILGIARTTLNRYSDMGLIKFKVGRNGRSKCLGSEIIRCWGGI